MNRNQFIYQVKSTQKAFRRFLVALCCGDSQLADDIAQEAYIKAYLACNTIEQTEKFQSWLFRIGYTTFLNNKRAEKSHTDYKEALEIIANNQTDDSFLYQELYMALSKLPTKERTSVLLYYMEGYTIKEIAELVEATTDAVKQHLSRGRNHLRHLLSTT